jgi:NAD(P)H-nitrite reductase large subunit
LAVWLAAAGLHPLLIDAEPRAGGAGWRGTEGEVLRLSLAGADLDYRPGTEVIDIAADGRLTLLDATGRLSTEPAADCLVLAPGAVERLLPIPGWTLPGVLGLGALQRLAKCDGVRPAGPLVLAGSGPLLRLAAAQMMLAGTTPKAIVDAGRAIGFGLLAGLARRPATLLQGMGMELRRLLARVPLIHGLPVALRGVDQIEAVELADGRLIEATVVGLGYGLQSNTELARLAGLRLAWDAGWHAWLPVRGAEFQSSRGNVFVLGDGAGLGGRELAEAEGICLAGKLIERADLALPAGLAEARRRAGGRIPGLRKAGQALAAWSQVSAASLGALPDSAVVCRCEGSTAGQIRSALAAGYRSSASIKLASRAGMGTCQGRTCWPGLQALMDASGVPPSGCAPATARSPLRPVPASAFLEEQPSPDIR